MTTPAERTRDIVVIGCSAGGVGALSKVISQLPADFEGSVLVVLHLAPMAKTLLVDILQRVSKLPVSWADQGDRVERRHVYVAPADTHMLFTNGHLRLSRGARENHARPSIDKLFRSAAAAHGNRVIGVLLTGMLDDGVAGLRAIADAGGKTIVQDPVDAEFADLPSRAIAAMVPDLILPLTAIGPALVAATSERVPDDAIPPALALEAEIDHAGHAAHEQLDQLGARSAIGCPECHATTWEIGPPMARRYRCPLGHVVSARDLVLRSADEVEQAMWTAVRALHVRAEMLESLASEAVVPELSASYRRLATRSLEEAELARKFIHELARQ